MAKTPNQESSVDPKSLQGHVMNQMYIALLMFVLPLLLHIQIYLEPNETTSKRNGTSRPTYRWIKSLFQVSSSCKVSHNISHIFVINHTPQILAYASFT